MIVPTATYRIQFREGMGFAAATKLVPYFRKLGISHLYASPIYTAVSGSTHGYDVVDHNDIDPALGGREGFDRLCAALKDAGMGMILDIVPNHMAASLENRWWRSVVEWGEQSRYARHFDIDWSRKLTLPILGRPYTEILQADELALKLDEEHGCLALAYFHNLLPLHPGSWELVLSWLKHPLAKQLAELAGRAAPDREQDLHLAVRDFVAREPLDGLKEEMAQCSRERSFIDEVHAQQPWELTFWKEARTSLSYRRFFEVTGLVGVRVEDEKVFADVHALTLELVRSGKVDGLRIDHVDGLADPGDYLRRLRKAVGPDVWVVVEKILNGDEQLPGDWPVAGATGYEFIDAMADLLADADGMEALSRSYMQETGAEATELLRETAKTQIVTKNFEGELRQVARLLAEIDSAPDEEAVRQALIRLIVAMPVYRTYGAGAVMGAADREVLDRAAAAAREADPNALEFVRAVLAGDEKPDDSKAELARVRFEQLCGPAMAKGVEDTLFYRDHRVLALNEVGSDPGRPSPSLERFHGSMKERRRLTPHGLTATATHDTKRGEDARARLFALTEAPNEWAQAVTRWRQGQAGNVVALPDGPAPEPEVEWLIYQALAGVWPDDLDFRDAGRLVNLRRRFLSYLEKALREAKLRTSWTDPNAAYEEAVKAYAANLLDARNTGFLNDFAETLATFRRAGWLNSLTQTLVKLTAPGIPDIYQGSEGGDFSLVDPDNRRAIDFDSLAQKLGKNPGHDMAAIKQSMITKILDLRLREPTLFASGDYFPLKTEGAKARNLAAFARHHADCILIVVAPRLTLGLVDDHGLIPAANWEDTAVIVPDKWVEKELVMIFSGEPVTIRSRIPARLILSQWPCAALFGAT